VYITKTNTNNLIDLMNLYKKLCVLYTIYTILLILYKFSGLNIYKDHAYLECLTNCSNVETVCHLEVVENTCINCSNKNINTYINNTNDTSHSNIYDNGLLCAKWSDKYPKEIYLKSFTKSGECSVSIFKCYHNTANDTPSSHCACNSLFNSLLNGIWFFSFVTLLIESCLDLDI
jgi:hypothetical protein